MMLVSPRLLRSLLFQSSAVLLANIGLCSILLLGGDAISPLQAEHHPGHEQGGEDPYGCDG